MSPRLVLENEPFADGIQTTNRPGKIDDSFISRITASIRYPKLSPEVRHMIWLKFYEMYENSKTPKIKITSEARTRLRKDDTDLNGREIRNSKFTPALSPPVAHATGAPVLSRWTGLTVGPC